jgi:hypothetical protein
VGAARADTTRLLMRRWTAGLPQTRRRRRPAGSLGLPRGRGPRRTTGRCQAGPSPSLPSSGPIRHGVMSATRSPDRVCSGPADHPGRPRLGRHEDSRSAGISSTPVRWVIARDPQLRDVRPARPGQH